MTLETPGCGGGGGDGCACLRGKKNHIYTNGWQEVEEGVPPRTAEESLKTIGERGQTDGSMTPVGCMW